MLQVLMDGEKQTATGKALRMLVFLSQWQLLQFALPSQKKKVREVEVWEGPLDKLNANNLP